MKYKVDNDSLLAVQTTYKFFTGCGIKVIKPSTAYIYSISIIASFNLRIP